MKYTQQDHTTLTIVGDALSQGVQREYIGKQVHGPGLESIISKHTWTRHYEAYYSSVHNMSMAGASNTRSVRKVIESLESIGEDQAQNQIVIWQISHPRNNELHNADYNFWLQYDYIQDKVYIDDIDYHIDCPPHIQKIADDALEYFREADKHYSAKFINNKFFESCIQMQEWVNRRKMRLLTITANETRLPWDDLFHRFSSTYNWITERHIISNAITTDDFLHDKDDLIDHDLIDNHDFITPNRMGYKYMADCIWKRLDLLNWIHKPDE